MKDNIKIKFSKFKFLAIVFVMILGMFTLSLNNTYADEQKAKIHYEYVEDKNLSKEEISKLKKDFDNLKAEKDSSYYIVYKNSESFLQSIKTVYT